MGLKRGAAVQLLVVSLMLAPPSTLAQEEAPILIPPVTVTGRRMATPILNIPGSVQVIEREEIQQQSHAHRTLQDLLPRLVPGSTSAFRKSMMVPAAGRRSGAGRRWCSTTACQ